MRRAQVIHLFVASSACAALNMALPGSSLATAPFSLFTRSDLPVGTQNSVAVADLDRDGKEDLATAFYGNFVSVFLGNGDGSFVAPSNIPIGGPGASSVTAGDLNGDDKLDLLVSYEFGVAVLLGAGDGSFAPPLTFAAGSRPKYVRTADFNADGRLDALVNGPGLFVRLGNGDGTFGPRLDVPFTGCPYGEPIRADFNSDGKLDLAVPNPCPFGAVSIFLGNGNGTFQPQADLPVQSGADFSDVGDMNGDGHPDIVVSNFNSGSVSVILGNGDGTFQPRADIDIGLEAAGVKVGDFNMDGVPDIAATTHGTHILFLLAGRGDGTFEPKLGFSTSPHPYSLQKGDLNGDGLLDLLTPVAAPFDGLNIFLNAAGPPAGNPPVITAPTSLTVSEGAPVNFTVTATDPDGDPILGLTADVCCAGRTFTTNPSNTSGTFTWTATGAAPSPYYVVFAARNVLAAQAVTYITVTAPGVNRSVELAPVGNKTVDEQSLLSFTASATDPDAGQTPTFLLTLGTPAATGATIDGTTGAFTWTPTEAQGPGQYPITVRVTDNGSPPTFDFESIQVQVRDVNSAPILAPIGDKCAVAGTPITFTANATDTDVPPNVLTFSLLPGAPAGATINGSTGAFSWTPSGSGTFPVTIMVTDNATPPLSDSKVFAIVLGCGAREAPVLAPIGGKTVNELVQLAFTATSTDPDPNDFPTFSLDGGAPAGATINPSTGVFSWTPTEAQGPGGYSMTLRATDNSNPPLSDFETITVTVNDVNGAPVLAPIGNKTACGPGAPLTFTATATDADLPPNVLTFSLDPGAPAGATINGSTGAFSWTPSTFGSFPVTVRVTDNGTPPLSDFEVFSITVSGCANAAPVLGAIGNKTVNELATLAFTATATDADVPAQTLTFSLDAGSPAGASITALTGAFSWTPTEAQGPGTYPITVRVTDNGTPALSDFEAIAVTVNEVNVAPVLFGIGNKTVTAGANLAFIAGASDVDVPPNTQCFTLANFPPVGATITCGGVFSWTPTLGQVGVSAITVRVTDNGFPPLSDEETILVTVLQQAGAPTAHAGGPYSGVVNAPVSFDGTGSFDPNGDALTYHWDFGDGDSGSGATPSHTYTAPGTYNVTLRVTDPDGNFDEDVTTVTIGDQISVVLLLKNDQSTLNLGKGDVRVAIEKFELQYTNVIIGSLRLSTDYPNAGTVSECAADPKHTRVGDLDRNSVPDLELRFPSACLSDLFRNTPNNTTVNLIITGEFLTSTGSVPLRGVAVVNIKKGGGGGAAVLVYPNPMNPQAMLSFVTTNAGGASVQLFDLQGRLVRTLLPEQHLEAGAHEVTIDGMNDKGTRLSSGIYFYRVRTADGTTEGSISVLK